jgi:hypothetical protein
MPTSPTSLDTGSAALPHEHLKLNFCIVGDHFIVFPARRPVTVKNQLPNLVTPVPPRWAKPSLVHDSCARFYLSERNAIGKASSMENPNICVRCGGQ